MNFQFKEFDETEDYILCVNHVIVDKCRYLPSDILQFADGKTEWMDLRKDRDDQILLSMTVDNEDFRELMLYCIAIAPFDPETEKYGSSHFKWIGIWKNLIKLGIVTMKKQWKCLE